MRLARLLPLLASLFLSTACYDAARLTLDLPPFETAAGEATTLMLPMRDGVKLYTEVYLPEGEGPWPVILIRNPYNFVGGAGALAKLFSRYGYVGVYQLARGRATSEGTWMPFFNERNDGIDTLAWITKQPWHDGNIGLFGASYLSMVQWAMADRFPPQVKTMIPMVWGSDLREVAFSHGMFRFEVATAWASLMYDETLDALNFNTFWKTIAHRPHLEADEKIIGHSLPWYRDWLQSASADAPLWKIPDNLLLRAMPEKVTVPVLMVSGWYDIFVGSQLDDFNRMATRDRSRLIVGPWTHLMGGSGDGVLPLPDKKGAHAMMDRFLNWFDHHLKGEPLDDWGPVETYAIGGGWQRRESWPPAAKPARLYFAETARAQACTGGRLAAARPEGEDSISYVYDPADPVPSRGGAGLLAFAIPGWSGTPPSMRDQIGLCERDDVLTFTSLYLREDLHLAGRFNIRLTVRSDAEDTAFTVKIMDVDANGRAVNITDTIMALAYRNGDGVPVPYAPHSDATLVLQTWPTEWVVKKGHRLRVDVSSSNFPAYNVHPNVAAPWYAHAESRIANQTVLTGPGREGWLELPVVSH